MYPTPINILTIVSFLHLAHALPAGSVTPSSTPALISSEPDTLLGKTYNILNHDKALLGITLHVQALAESWENIGPLANVARDRPLTRATRFQRVHLKRAHLEAGEKTYDDDMNLLSKQVPPPPAFIYSPSSPPSSSSLSSMFMFAATTPTAVHPALRPAADVRPVTSAHTATPQRNSKQHKEDVPRKHRTSGQGSYL